MPEPATAEPDAAGPDAAGPGRATRGPVRVLVRLSVVLAAVVMGVFALVWLLQRSLIYFPDASVVPQAQQVLPEGQDVVHHTEDGLELGAWFVPPEPEVARDMAVLYLPGNGGNRAGRTSIATELRAQGFAVLLVDYRGYGGNPGRPSEAGLAADARSAQAALADLGYPPECTIYLGESLGTAVAAHLQTQVPPAGVVLRSPMTNLADVGRAHYPVLPVRTLLREDYDVMAALQGAAVPVAVMYSQDDEVIPADLSAQVSRLEQVGQVRELSGAGHNDAVMFGPALADLVAGLADQSREPNRSSMAC